MTERYHDASSPPRCCRRPSTARGCSEKCPQSGDAGRFDRSSGSRPDPCHGNRYPDLYREHVSGLSSVEEHKSPCLCFDARLSMRPENIESIMRRCYEAAWEFQMGGDPIAKLLRCGRCGGAPRAAADDLTLQPACSGGGGSSSSSSSSALHFRPSPSRRSAAPAARHGGHAGC
ncbi:hypothetical protein BDY21DRAFT_51873 [Lineolata rhizophorae]|uniref:Uncharacterized protein n=1 Tax=Lineolata rhizophorae TaxID=578093 RepID=A0A6A6NXQ6_9PEZI|nr:hypothetical protein BDY21DRAFT_51873 [Lineolata rhizophorae]